VALRSDGTIVLFNRSSENISGYSADEVVGKRPWDVLVAPEDVASERELFDNILEQALPTERETTWICKDGSRRVLSWSNTLEKDCLGEPKVVIDTGSDVTDFKRADAALRREKEVVDLLKTIAVTANEATNLEEALRISVDEICRRTEWRIGAAYLVTDGRATPVRSVAPTDCRGVELPAITTWSPRGTQPVWLGSGSAATPSFVFPIAFAGEVIALFQLSTQESIRPDERVVAIMAHAAAQIARLVERKRAEEERGRLLAREREALLAAERGNRVRDLFLATISHELRTPLTAILAWTELLRRGSLDSARSRQAVERIEENARAQGALVDDLLDISRSTQDKLTLDLKLVDLVAIARDCIDTLAPSAQKRGVSLEFEVHGAMQHLRADPVRLRQILGNLLSNAIKFSPPKTTVSTTLESVNSEHARRYRISIRDHGAGIRPEFLEQVFEPFSQADPSSTRAYGGLGLGLAIVRSLVALHGGTVVAESPGEGMGSTFTVELPGPVEGGEAVTQQPGQPMPDPIRPASPFPLHGVRILVVDDQDDAREVIAELLSTFGANVRTAESVLRAFDSLSSDPPDVLLTDIAMPVEDGYALLRRVRSSPAGGDSNAADGRADRLCGSRGSGTRCRCRIRCAHRQADRD
jgi:PAS domain S-box-containing protein